jgi:hypothetical protein
MCQGTTERLRYPPQEEEARRTMATVPEAVESIAEFFGRYTRYLSEGRRIAVTTPLDAYLQDRA